MKRLNFLAWIALSVVMALALLASISVSTMAAPPVKGAIFTTDASCVVVNANHYTYKEDVHLVGGPAKPGAAGLPDGYYYLKITAPNGRLLGTSVGSGNDTPIHVTNGEFDQCYNLYSLLIRASDGTTGYDDTPNNGGEYKVWVSNERSFANNSSKTDNFQVKPAEIIGPF